MSATPPAPSPRDGPLISGRYRILRRLGAGSVGTVYLARDLSARRPLALKVIQRELLSADGARSLQEEFRAIASLHHPQIAAAYDFGYSEEGGLPFYTREHVDGAPLPPGPPDADGQADPGRFLRPLFDLLDALHYLHTHEILHLDIHAGNLIVANDPERGAVLIDFGLFRPRRVSLASSVFLSRSSLAPEVLHGGSASFPADIYSVGRLLLYRLTGSYDGEARLPREIPGWGPRLTLELERIVGKAIQREPEQRFSSALEFREALVAALGSGDGAPRPGEPGELTVGREPELARLEEGLRRAVAGRTAALWFKGPAGVGKSRLLTEARWRGQIRGLEVADVRFLPEADAAPAARQILRSLRAGRRGGHWLAALSREHGGSSEERARRAASAFFSRAGPPLVLLLDDFENADRESRLLGEALLAECLGRLREGSPGRGLLGVVASSRSPRRGVVRSGARSIVRPLRPLSEKSSRELLRAWLRPLEAPDRLLSRLARPSRGNALRLRRLAVALRSEYGATGKLPADVRLPLSSRISLAAGRRDWGERERKVLEVLAAFGRGADREEIAAAADMTPKSMATALRRLRQAEVVASLPEGRRRLYYLADPRARAALLGGLARHDVSRMYRRAADWLRKNPDPSPREREALARHLLAAGRQREGAAAALEAAAVLSEKGLHEPAVRLLEDASRRETNRRRRLELAEEISKRHHEAGDHLEAIAQLEPVFRAEETYLRGREAVRIRRRLGVHYHRAGRAEAAVRFFEEARRRAKESRDREELVFIFSELAELHTFRGEYAEAERACRAGLELLERGPRALENVVGAMEITLRASLGHLELRRFELERARREFEAALALARSYGTAADRAVILNNLGIAYNQLDRLGKARSSFRQAEKLLAAAGERRALVQTACNLAVIAAKGGDADR
ncbi:MAG: AAA family ATPase, partial [Planctomycetota bacterium]|nr:AAA family ATPase [Planctomycetota bacterium]